MRKTVLITTFFCLFYYYAKAEAPPATPDTVPVQAVEVHD